MIRLFPTGARQYFNQDGLLHNENGPAIIDEVGSKAWIINGHYHREDCPAIMFKSGKNLYFYKGKRVNVNSTEEFIRYIKLLAFI